jgi:hypothetical protein
MHTNPDFLAILAGRGIRIAESFRLHHHWIEPDHIDATGWLI